MRKLSAHIVFLIALLSHTSPARALVIDATQAAVRTVGGPVEGGWNLWSNGRISQPVQLAGAGTYTIVARAWGSPAGGVWPEMALVVSGRRVRTVSVRGKEAADFTFHVELPAAAHEIGVAFLNDAQVGKEDRNLYVARLVITPPAGVAEPTLIDKRQFAEDGLRRERETLAATAAAIEKHRKADAQLRVVDAAGRPIAGAKVTVEQTRHEFLFGGNIYGFDRCRTPAQNDQYKRRFAELFNYATVGFYWHGYEPQRGKPNYAHTDKVVAWCRAQGIRVKGHPLLWDHEAGVPPWSHGQPSPELQRQRVTDILQRYRGKIEFWEVVNEPAHATGIKIDEPYRWAREADPRGCLIVNDYHVLADDCPEFLRLLTAAKESGVPLDGIGIQAHEPQMSRFPLDRIAPTLDHYAALGKGLHITEFTPTSAGQRWVGWYRDGVWDEAAQAEYAEQFYRVVFAHPAVRAITWWDLCDQDTWLPGGGMLRKDLSPKPVYERLRRLIHDEWHTRSAGTTDAAGRFTFRGFLGTYRLLIETPSGRVEREVHLSRVPQQETTIQM